MRGKLFNDWSCSAKMSFIVRSSSMISWVLCNNMPSALIRRDLVLQHRNWLYRKFHCSICGPVARKIQRIHAAFRTMNPQIRNAFFFLWAKPTTRFTAFENMSTTFGLSSAGFDISIWPSSIGSWSAVRDCRQIQNLHREIIETGTNTLVNIRPIWLVACPSSRETRDDRIYIVSAVGKEEKGILIHTVFKNIKPQLVYHQHSRSS